MLVERTLPAPIVTVLSVVFGSFTFWYVVCGSWRKMPDMEIWL